MMRYLPVWPDSEMKFGEAIAPPTRAIAWPDSEMKFGEAIAPPTRAIDISKMTLHSIVNL